MFAATSLFLPLLLLAGQGLTYTWPDVKVDHLESLLYQQQQYHGSLVASDVKYCFLSVFDLDKREYKKTSRHFTFLVLL